MGERSERAKQFASLLVQGAKKENIEVVIYEPVMTEPEFVHSKGVNDLNEFKQIADVIVANRIDDLIADLTDKVYTRDLFGGD